MRVICSIGLLLMLLLAPARAANAARPTTAPIATAVNLKSLPQGQQAVIAVVVDVPEGLHAQSNTPSQATFIPFKVTIEPDPAVEVFAPVYPQGKDETYPELGKLNVYTGRVVTYVPIQVKPDAPLGALTLRGQVQYQMCDDRVCFRPQRPKISIETQIAPAGTALEPNEPELFKGFDFSKVAGAVGGSSAAPAVSAPKITLFGRELVSGSYLFPFIAAVIIGMVFNVMPCVLPVVPLKIMGFYQTAQHSRARSVALSIVFALGIISIFAALGLLIFVLQFVKEWGRVFGNPYFLGAIVVLLLAFALWQFGVFEFILPTGVYRLMPQGETVAGNFLFGAFTAILSTPCTFGLFLGLLIWAATQPGAIGFSLMIAVGVGMALPYVVLSGFPELARRFPRSGPWAELVKQMMGFLLVASAVFFARRFIVAIVSDAAFWWLLFATVAAAGIFLVVRTVQFSPRLGARLTAAVIALLLVAPALAFTIRQTNPPIQWQAFTPETLQQAREDGKLVVLEFTAAWCGNCLALESTVLHDPRTVKAFEEHNVVPIRVDLTDEDAPGWKILSQISPVGAIPLTAVYAPSLAEPIRLSGIYSTSELLAALERARGTAGNATARVADENDGF